MPHPTGRRVDDEMHLAVRDQVEHMGPSFVDLLNDAHRDAAVRQCSRRTTSGDDVEAERVDATRKGEDQALVFVAHGDEHRALGGQLDACSHL